MIDADSAAILRNMIPGPFGQLLEAAEKEITDFTARVAAADLSSDEDVVKARNLKSQLKGMIHMLDTMKEMVNESEPQAV